MNTELKRPASAKETIDEMDSQPVLEEIRKWIHDEYIYALPITEYINKAIWKWYSGMGWTQLDKTRDEVKYLEQASQKKIREEEINRMVGILDEIIEQEMKRKPFESQRVLQEVKERILSTN